VEYGPRGIRANVVAPGYFASEIPRDPEVVERMNAVVARNPIARVGTPDDLAGIVVYLLSDASRYHTGDVLVVDGGMSIHL
jgi:NAD(P)-dependent dehydrogenase (short-subunit alcohol dehydrogenase family)